MEDLAKRTGGRVLDVSELTEWAREMPSKQSPVMDSFQTPLWHLPWMFVAALLLLVTEWWLEGGIGCHEDDSFYCAAAQLGQAGLNAADFNTTQSRQVLVVAGAGGEEEYGELFAEWVETLAKAFEGNASELVHITNGSEETGARKTIETKLKEWAEAEEREIWIVLVGHGTFDGKEAKFNLVGKDVSDKEFQHWLKPHDGPLVFINTSSCSAPFINALSGRTGWSRPRPRAVTNKISAGSEATWPGRLAKRRLISTRTGQSRCSRRF